MNSSYFSQPLWNFAQRISALEELASAVTPALVELQKRPGWSDGVRQSLQALPEDQRETAGHILERIPELWLKFHDRDISSAAAIAEEISSQDEAITITVDETGFSISASDRELAQPIVLFVDDFTRRGVDEWAKWLTGGGLKLPLGECAHDWDSAREVFERRNLIVHHNGQVSRQYLAKVSSTKSAINQGQVLEVDQPYLDSAIDEMLTLGLVLGVRVWGKLTRDYESISEWIINQQLDLLMRGRPLVATQLGSAIETAKFDAQSEIIIKVNAWIGRKSTEGLDAIRAEVEAWDTRPLSGLFDVAKAALLNDHEKAAAAVRWLIDRRELDVVDVRRWPLFEDLRASSLLDDLVKPLTATVEAPEQDDAHDGDPEGASAIHE